MPHLTHISTPQRAAITTGNTWMAFVAGAMLLLALAVVGKGKPLVNKLIGIIFSFMWASTALQVTASPHLLSLPSAPLTSGLGAVPVI